MKLGHIRSEIGIISWGVSYNWLVWRVIHKTRNSVNLFKSEWSTRFLAKFVMGRHAWLKSIILAFNWILNIRAIVFIGSFSSLFRDAHGTFPNRCEGSHLQISWNEHYSADYLDKVFLRYESLSFQWLRHPCKREIWIYQGTSFQLLVEPPQRVSYILSHHSTESASLKGHSCYPLTFSKVSFRQGNFPLFAN